MTIGRVGRAARHVGVMQVRVFGVWVAAGQAVGRVVGSLSAVAWQTRPDQTRIHQHKRASFGGSMAFNAGAVQGDSSFGVYLGSSGATAR